MMSFPQRTFPFVYNPHNLAPKPNVVYASYGRPFLSIRQSTSQFTCETHSCSASSHTVPFIANCGVAITDLRRLLRLVVNRRTGKVFASTNSLLHTDPSAEADAGQDTRVQTLTWITTRKNPNTMSCVLIKYPDQTPYIPMQFKFKCL